MKHWCLRPVDPEQTAREACAQSLIDAVGRASFARQALAALHPMLRAASWSVYQVWRDRPPVLHLSASHGVADTTLQCFRAYAEGLYRRDHSFDLLRRGPGGAASRSVMMHMTAEEAPNADHREQIYLRHDVRERLSLARLETDGSVLALNLYRHGGQGAYGSAETERLAGLAPVLTACVMRHLASGTQDESSLSSRDTLRRRCPALTERELDVCERLLDGLSHDGIAADLGLSVATVKTYRARAFERLGLHFRSELFALCRPAH